MSARGKTRKPWAGAPPDEAAQYQKAAIQALGLVASSIDKEHEHLAGAMAGGLWLEIQRAHLERQVIAFLVALVRGLAIDVGKGTGEDPATVVERVVRTSE